MTDWRVETLTGAALIPVLPDLARLRTAVFRTWPYLYDGDGDYENDYLRRYAERPGAAVVVARAGGAVVGASTCVPLAQESDGIAAPFRARGWDIDHFFYYGESVLLPDWRGRGIGVAFFDAREAHARAASPCDFACFCSVQRPADHPAQPPGHVPLDAFWRKRGFTPYPELVCHMRWKEVGGDAEVDNSLSFWLKSLTGAALP